MRADTSDICLDISAAYGKCLVNAEVESFKSFEVLTHARNILSLFE